MLAGRMPPIAVVLMVAGAIVVAHAAQAKPDPCIPADKKTNLKLSPMINVFSPEGPVVANVAGYLELYNSAGFNSSYLPVDINSVTLGGPESDGTRSVTLTGRCVRFRNIKYKMIAGEQPYLLYDFSNVEMLVKNDAQQDKTLKKICDFDQQFAFEQDDIALFYCKRAPSHRCSVGDKPIVNLVLKSFELEIGGRLRNAERGLFTANRWGDICYKAYN